MAFKSLLITAKAWFGLFNLDLNSVIALSLYASTTRCVPPIPFIAKILPSFNLSAPNLMGLSDSIMEFPLYIAI